MKYEIMRKKVHAECESVSMALHIFDNVYCSKCGKPMKWHEGLVDTSEEEGYYSPDSDLLYTCECDDKYKTIIRPDSLNALKSSKNKVFKVPIEQLVPEASPFRETTRGVNYNDETGCISVYSSGFEYIIPTQTGALIKKPWVSRVSLNMKTGRAICINNGFIHKDSNCISRCEWGVVNVRTYLGKEEVITFINKVIELAKLPVKVEIYGKKMHHDIYRFTCGNTARKVEGLEAISAIIGLTIAPNVYIRYDKHKNIAEFREEATLGKFYNCESLAEFINPFIPTTKRFRDIQPRELMDEGDYVKTISSALDIPLSKMFNKYYRKNPMLMGYVAFCKSCGIKENSNLLKMIDTFLPQLEEWRRSNEPKMVTFLKALIRNNGENAAVSKLLYLKTDSPVLYLYGYLNDISVMYSKVVNVCRIPIRFDGSLIKIHNRLSTVYPKVREPEKVINYSKKETTKVASYDDRYEVKLPESTKRLIDIGEKMGICVGSYGSDAVTKRCTIYYVQDKETNDYKACIEMRNNKLIQAKGMFNNILEGKIADIVKRWVSDYSVNTKGCYDYQMLEQYA